MLNSIRPDALASPQMKGEAKNGIRPGKGDASNYRQVPIGLVIPVDEADVIAAVAVCRKFGAPILSRGGGTSLAGQGCNAAVVFDFSKYLNRIVELDPEQRFARVQSGLVLDTLRDAAEEHGLTFAPDPSTHNRCTLGGMIGNNSSGTHSLMGGKVQENVEQMRVLLYDGLEEAADLVGGYGGTISGEHGDGHARAFLYEKMFGPELVEGFRSFKRLWDPDNKLNPGKVIDPYPPEAFLKLGADYNPAQVETHFRFPDDQGSFEKATQRCVGVGACRKTDAGTMCPSYQVTREEIHSTRGRAHLLFEMLQGELLQGGWHDERVKESMDLCLACKGCKSECPTNVDIATHKSEFLSHYYEGRARP
jgi:hypothetical protein